MFDTRTKLIYFAAGAVIGGLTAATVSTLVQDYMNKKEDENLEQDMGVEQEWSDEEKPAEPQKISKWEKTDYNKRYISIIEQKPELKDIVPSESQPTIYEITAEQFQDDDHTDYGKVGVDYYNDVVLFDGVEVKDWQERLGEGSDLKFPVAEVNGEIMVSVIYIRNDALQCDYEIARVMQNFYETEEEPAEEVGIKTMENVPPKAVKKESKKGKNWKAELGEE
jgi:hypothetical protein